MQNLFTLNETNINAKLARIGAKLEPWKRKRSEILFQVRLTKRHRPRPKRHNLQEADPETLLERANHGSRLALSQGSQRRLLRLKRLVAGIDMVFQILSLRLHQPKTNRAIRGIATMMMIHSFGASYKIAWSANASQNLGYNFTDATESKTKLPSLK